MNFGTISFAMECVIAALLTDKTRSVLPLHITGTSGCGKTARAMSLAEVFGLHGDVVAAPQTCPEDIAGIPYAVKVTVEGKELDVMKRMPDSRVVDIVRAGKGGSLLVFDEISDAARSVQSAMHGPLLDGRWGDIQTPQHARIACSNPPHISTTGGSLSRPMAKRFTHLEFRPDARSWADGEMNGWAVEKSRASTSGDWNQNNAKWSGIFAGFMVSFPGYLNADNPEFPSELRRGIGDSDPSPCERTWSAARALCAYVDHNDYGVDVMSVLVEGTVGSAAGQKFMAYYREMDLPDPEDILKDPLGIDIPRRGDQIIALALSVQAAVLQRNSVERYRMAWKFLARLKREGHGGAAAMIVPALAKRGSMPKGLGKIPEEVGSFMDLVKDSGIFSKS